MWCSLSPLTSRLRTAGVYRTTRLSRFGHIDTPFSALNYDAFSRHRMTPSVFLIQALAVSLMD